MNEFKIIMPEGSYNYYEEVLKNIKGVLKMFNRDSLVSIGALLDFIEEVEKTL